MRALYGLLVAAVLLCGGELRAQPLELLSSKDLVGLPTSGGRMGVGLRTGRFFSTVATLSTEVTDVDEKSTFRGRIRPGDHILAVQGYRFEKMADMVAYVTSLPPKSPVRVLVADGQTEQMRVVTGTLVAQSQLSANRPTRVATNVATQASNRAPLIPAVKDEPSCLKEAGKGAAAAVLAAVILVGADCLFTACAFTAAALATSTGVVTTTAVALKGTAVIAGGAATGCAHALLE